MLVSSSDIQDRFSGELSADLLDRFLLPRLVGEVELLCTSPEFCSFAKYFTLLYEISVITAKGSSHVLRNFQSVFQIRETSAK